MTGFGNYYTKFICKDKISLSIDYSSILKSCRVVGLVMQGKCMTTRSSLIKRQALINLRSRVTLCPQAYGIIQFCYTGAFRKARTKNYKYAKSLWFYHPCMLLETVQSPASCFWYGTIYQCAYIKENIYFWNCFNPFWAKPFLALRTTLDSQLCMMYN